MTFGANAGIYVSHFETNVIWVLKIYYIILEDNKR